MTWNGQTLTRTVQTSYTLTPRRGMAIYHLYNPLPGTANIAGTLGSRITDKWVTAHTLCGVNTGVAPITASANAGSDMAGVLGWRGEWLVGGGGVPVRQPRRFYRIQVKR